MILRTSNRALWLAMLVVAALTVSACGPPGPVEVGPNGGGAEGDHKQVKEEALRKFKEGVEQFTANPTVAKQRFQEAVDEDESFGEAWYNLGVLEETSGNTSAAIDAYEKAIETRPTLGDPYVNLAYIALDKGEREKAKDYLLKVVDDEKGVDPFHVQGNLNLGMIYRLEGEALVYAANKTADMQASLDMGNVSKRSYTVPDDAKLKFAEAVRHVRKALAGDSNNIASYENLAAVYYDLDSLEVATLVCEQAIQKQVERNKELDEMLAEGKISAAEHASKLIQGVDMAPVYNTFGLVWLARGEVALAYHRFREAVDANPEFVPALLNVAGVAVNVQDYETAYGTYAAILAGDKGNIEARLSQAVAARGMGNLEEAEQVYRSMMAQDATYAPAVFNLGILYQEYHRDLETAKKIYEDFVAMPTAMEQVPDRVEEARGRIQQIENIWEAQRKAEVEKKAMEEELRQMDELRKQQELELKQLENEAGGSEGAPADGGPAADGAGAGTE